MPSEGFNSEYLNKIRELPEEYDKPAKFAKALTLHGSDTKKS